MNKVPQNNRSKTNLASAMIGCGFVMTFTGVRSFFDDSMIGDPITTFIIFIVGASLLIIGIIKAVQAAKESRGNTEEKKQTVNTETANNKAQYLYCPYCRSIIMEGSKFCPECGKQIDSKPGSGHIAIEIIEEKPKEYFRDIIFKNFSNYTIQEDVPVTQLTGDINDVFKLYKDRPNQVYKAEWGRPYDFVLFDGDKVKAVIMLGNGHSHSINVKYLISKMFAKKLKVPYISFYTQFPNKEDYVINRIKEYLGK